MPMSSSCIRNSSSAWACKTSPATRAPGHSCRPHSTSESYSYSARNGQKSTWDVECARGLIARRRPAARPIRLTSDDLAEWLERHCEVDRNHLAHIPADRLEEPVLLAPAPDGRGQVLIDGSHRAALRIQTGLPVDAHMLTNTESVLAIAITPLTMYAVHQALQERDC